MQTEFEFTLPRGYVDASGQVHRLGRMRLATAFDEIESLALPSVQANQAYLPVALLSRVVTQLGDFSPVTPQLVAGLFAADLAYLEDLYQRLNAPEPIDIGAVCPTCGEYFHVRVAPLSQPAQSEA